MPPDNPTPSESDTSDNRQRRWTCGRGLIRAEWVRTWRPNWSRGRLARLEDAGGRPASQRRPRLFAWAGCIGPLLVVAFCGLARGEVSTGDGFEGSETSWRFVANDTPYQVQLHQRTNQAAHSGSGGEAVQVSVSQGSYVYLGLDITPCHPIAEFQPSIWLRANRAGIRFLARVVFPRTADPQTGKPLSQLVGTATYTQTGTWQQLRIDDLPKLVVSAVHPLRAQFGRHVDGREAYVDRLLLNVYCGPGVTKLAIDDLELPHLVPLENVPRRPSPAVSTEVTKRPRVELVGSVLQVDGSPFFPRLVEYQGESLTFLQKLGFNGVQLAKTPDDALLDEARQTGMWLVCPPPALAEDEAEVADDWRAKFAERYRGVLAWHLGQGLTARDLEAMRGWVEKVHRADEQTARPLVCDPADKLEQYGRLLGSSGILMMHRYLLGTTFELADFSTWLHTRPRLGMPGMPVWATIETQHSRQLGEQVSLLSAGQAPELVADYEQIRLMVQAALVAGVRGLSFASRLPLDGQDPATRLRAMTLSLVNLELDLIQPWVAAGNPTATISAAQITAANPAGENPGITGAILKAHQARLLLPMWAGTGAQYVPDQLAGNQITFAVPAAPEDNTASELTVGGLRPLDKKRRVGGLHVTLIEFGPTSMVLLSNGIAVGTMNRQLPTVAAGAAQLQRDLAAHKLTYVTEIDRQLARLADRVLDAPRLFALARNDFTEAERALAQHDWLTACLASQRVARPLRLIERSHWEKAIASLGSPAASPLVATFGVVPYHWLLVRELENRVRSRSILKQGDMETQKEVWMAGWRLYKHGQTGIRGMGEFSKEHYSGKASLHLTVAAVDPDAPPSLLETPPLWLSSPDLPADAGQWFRIHGWVKVPKAVTASLDGLMIFDSLGGEPLAERIGKTEGWKEFTLYRAAPTSGPWRLIIALTGVGEAWIDGLTVETLKRPVTPSLSRGGRLPMTLPRAGRK